MAAQTGLFTQGPSVDDILAKRNKSQFDLQQQLMQQAAQGARDPAKMRAVSLLGSSLGRALGGSMGGGNGREELEAKEAAKQEDRGNYFTAASGTSEEMLAHIQVLQDKGHSTAALRMHELYKLEKEKEETKAKAKQEKTEDDLVTRANLESENMEAEQLQSDGKNLSSQLSEFNPNLAKLLGNGRATQKLLDLGHAQVVKMDEAGERGKKYNSQVSGAELNALQGTTNYDPTAMFNYNSKTKSYTAIGRTGSVAETDKGTTKSQEITEAYGYAAGTKEHQKLFQELLDIGPSLSINDIKAVRTDWSTSTETERGNIATADEITGLVDLSSLGAIGQESIIADRLVSRLFGGSDTKAQAEIAAFRSTGSVGKRLADTATMFLQGVYTTDTLEGFKKLAAFSKARNIDAYNNKLKTVISQYGMAQNLSTSQVSTLFGAPLEQDKAPSLKLSVGTETVVDGVTYVFKGGDSSGLANWEPK